MKEMTAHIQYLLSGKTSQDAKIESQDAQIQSLRSEIVGIKNFTSENLAMPVVSTVVGELLLFVLGEQPKPSMRKSSRFANAQYKRTPAKDKVAALAKIFCGQIQNFPIVADKMMDKRNGSSHCSSEIELRARVENALTAFETFPTLETDMRIELIILSKYDLICERFFPVSP